MKSKSVTAKDIKISMDTLNKLSDEYRADILQAFEIARECREVFVKSEQARLNGGASVGSNPLVMRTLTNAITESMRGASKDKDKSREAGDKKKTGDLAIEAIFESYFGVKGGKMQFSEFVGQFLFA